MNKQRYRVISQRAPNLKAVLPNGLTEEEDWVYEEIVKSANAQLNPPSLINIANYFHKSSPWASGICQVLESMKKITAVGIGPGRQFIINATGKRTSPYARCWKAYDAQRNL